MSDSLGDKLLIGLPELAHLASLSVRHLRRLDAARDIPGRVTVGRRVLFRTDIVREWIAAGCPDRRTSEALHRAGRSRS